MGLIKVPVNVEIRMITIYSQIYDVYTLVAKKSWPILVQYWTKIKNIGPILTNIGPI
jgi:hypothetical protein